MAVLACGKLEGAEHGAEAQSDQRPPELEREYLKCLARIEGIADSWRRTTVWRPSLSFRCLEDRSEAARADWTMRGMRTIGAVLDYYRGAGPGEYPRTDRIEDVLEAIAGLEPIELMHRDGWGTPLRYQVSEDAQYYELTSAGSDGQFAGVFFGDLGDGYRPMLWSVDFRRDIVSHGLGLIQAPMYFGPGESGCEDGRAGP